MIVFVNNKETSVQDVLNLSQLLLELNLLEKKGMAVAVNNQIVTKSNWNSFVVNKNDKITIIRAAQGG